MSQMEIDRVLAQIRTIRAEAGGPIGGPGKPQAAEGAVPAVSFAAVLRNGLDQVNATQLSARQAAADFELGKPGVELPQVMLEMQKASVSFRAAVEVRNKLVNAYQEIMNMPV
ncbi:MAG: flagellar hook-basal body complex protein FliE [Steroidobacteraceae bacterium]|nr:flagellar hook-basal body complex protein FliE [Nevskiaceae bacterium]MCP5339082.1 flagellar hook-basal body complex protein FliE [Nevskiaceae bacterium]MCP5359991.1 flagellar hook-basal body complex protein FliE [Nevskiaceae bacterium]MCP5472189.1 flagellar hook-basal body complex protein FliE [Nevskiaceae bacterium]